MAMMVAVGVVITNDTPIVQTVKVMVDVGQVVPGYLVCGFVHPDFSPELPVSSPIGQGMAIVNNLTSRHHMAYHACMINLAITPR
jgi:hypothetical protein